MFDITPRGNYVLIQEHPIEKTAGGIVLPGNHPYGQAPKLGQGNNTMFKVLKVGPGRRLETGAVVAIDLKVGDIICPRDKVDGKQMKQEWMFSGRSLALINADDVMGIITGDINDATPPPPPPIIPIFEPTDVPAPKV